MHGGQYNTYERKRCYRDYDRDRCRCDDLRKIHLHRVKTYPVGYSKSDRLLCELLHNYYARMRYFYVSGQSSRLQSNSSHVHMHTHTHARTHARYKRTWIKVMEQSLVTMPPLANPCRVSCVLLSDLGPALTQTPRAGQVLIGALTCSIRCTWYGHLKSHQDHTGRMVWQSQWSCPPSHKAGTHFTAG